MHARFYDPQQERFLSVDPEIASAELNMPQSWNRYQYAMNNPIRYIDPFGREAQCVPGLKPGDPPICSEVITVTAKALGGEAKQGNQKSPFDDPFWKRLQEQWKTFSYLSLDDFSFRHAPKKDLGDCIEDNSFSNVYTFAGNGANALLNRAVGPTGRSGIAGVTSHATSWENKLGRAVARRLYKAGAPKVAFRVHRLGRLAGRVAIVLTVFEGFYDIGTIIRCSALSLSQ